MKSPVSISRGSTPTLPVSGGPGAPLLVSIGDARTSKSDDGYGEASPGLLAQTLAYARELSILHAESKVQLATLAHQATHDGLTGLPNRTFLLERLDRMIVQPRDPGLSS